MAARAEAHAAAPGTPAGCQQTPLTAVHMPGAQTPGIAGRMWQPLHSMVPALLPHLLAHPPWLQTWPAPKRRPWGHLALQECQATHYSINSSRSLCVRRERARSQLKTGQRGTAAARHAQSGQAGGCKVRLWAGRFKQRCIQTSMEGSDDLGWVGLGAGGLGGWGLGVGGGGGAGPCLP